VRWGFWVVEPYPDDARRKEEEERKNEILVFAYKHPSPEIMLVVEVVRLSPPGDGLR
jgi:hypothetical protein